MYIYIYIFIYPTPPTKHKQEIKAADINPKNNKKEGLKIYKKGMKT